MRTIHKATRLALCFLLFGLLATPDANAENKIIQVSNNSSNVISVAFMYNSESKQDWLVTGWYVVPVGETKDFTFAVQSGIFYYYADSRTSQWAGTAASSPALTVVNEKFDYIAGKNKPSGNNPRVVKFREGNFGSAGYHRLNFTN